MKIKFKENVSSLENRIKIHDQYGSRNIDDWMLKKIRLKKNQAILDLGCGDGKQTFAINSFFSSKIKTKSYNIIGLDNHHELIKNANLRLKNENIKFIIGSFDKKLPFKDSSFDLIISSFAGITKMPPVTLWSICSLFSLTKPTLSNKLCAALSFWLA